jgi:hypothetical protein
LAIALAPSAIASQIETIVVTGADLTPRSGSSRIAC